MQIFKRSSIITLCTHQTAQVVTRDCAGCDGNNEGGTFEVAVTNSIGVAGCTTPKLDKAGTTDYGAGNTATFSGDELGPNSGGCKLVCYTYQ